MKRIERLRHVLAVCYCRLQPSPIHGIGVYAVRVITRGANPFRMLPASTRRSGSVRVSDDELDALPPRLAGLIRALFVPTDGKMYIPTWGTNIVSLAAYVNHSATPNLRTTDGFSFRTRRRIHEGEELTADYRSYGATGCLPHDRRKARRPGGRECRRPPCAAQTGRHAGRRRTGRPLPSPCRATR